MKKSFLSLAFLSMIVMAEDQSIECTKLLQFMRQAVELDARLTEVTGDLEEREKKFAAAWASMNDKERENAEKMCADAVTEFRQALQPKHFSKPDDFPAQCESVLTLSQEANSFYPDIDVKALEQNLFETWQVVDETGREKVIAACQKTEGAIKDLLKEAKEKQGKEDAARTQ